MADIFVGFGDSWANGDELDHSREKSYMKLLGEQFGVQVLNYAVSSSSIGHMLIQFQKFIATDYHPANRYHAVFFVTAKERAFYFDDNDHTIKHTSPTSVVSFQEDAYYKYYTDKLGDLNANRDIVGIQGLCRIYGIVDYWMLGWQKIPLWNVVDKGRFFALGDRPITTLFTSDGRIQPIIELVNPANQNPYIWPNSGHPNQLGHQIIADAMAKIIKL